MLTKSEEKFLKTYERQLQMPRWRFVLLYGLTWAFFTMIFTFVVALLFDLGNAAWQSGRSIGITLLIWTVAGIVYGLWSRSLLLKRCAKLKAKQNAAA